MLKQLFCAIEWHSLGQRSIFFEKKVISLPGLEKNYDFFAKVLLIFAITIYGWKEENVRVKLPVTLYTFYSYSESCYFCLSHWFSKLKEMNPLKKI